MMAAATSDSDSANEWVSELVHAHGRPPLAKEAEFDNEWLHELVHAHRGQPLASTPHLSELVHAQRRPPPPITMPEASANALRACGFLLGANSLDGLTAQAATSPQVTEWGRPLSSAPASVRLGAERLLREPDIKAPSLLFRASTTQAAAMINARLATIGVAAFKIGVCFNPSHRFRGETWSYCHEGFTEMQLLSVTEATEARLLEKDLIANFRGRQGCHNHAPGGEGIAPSRSFCYVYCVFADATGRSFIHAEKRR